MTTLRSYPLFAFLFGYGMVQFTRSRTARGIAERDVRRMLRRRPWAMVLIGLFHAALLFVGDILGAYGLAGLLLVWLFFRRTERTLLVWASILGGLLTLFALLSLFGGLWMTLNPGAVAAGPGAGPFSLTATRDLTAGDPSYLGSMINRVTFWAAASPAHLLGRAIPIRIILGRVAARRGLLDDPAAHRGTLLRLAWVGIPIGLLGGLPGALTHVGVLDLHPAASWTFQAFAMATGIAGGIGYAAAFGLLALAWSHRCPALGDALSALGRRSLTFYLFQSVVFAPLLSAWGLGFGADLGTAAALALALAVWAISLGLAVALQRAGRRGPAEVLLRRLTYGRIDPAASAPIGPAPVQARNS